MSASDDGHHEQGSDVDGNVGGGVDVARKLNGSILWACHRTGGGDAAERYIRQTSDLPVWCLLLLDASVVSLVDSSGVLLVDASVREALNQTGSQATAVCLLLQLSQ